MNLHELSADPPDPMKAPVAEIRELWRKSPSGDVNPGGSWLDELQYYFNTGIFHAGLRLEKLERASRVLPPETAAECMQECSDLRKELSVCSAIATALFRLESQIQTHTTKTATS